MPTLFFWANARMTLEMGDKRVSDLTVEEFKALITQTDFSPV